MKKSNLFGLLFLLPLLARAGRAGLATGRMALHVTRAGIKIMGLVALQHIFPPEESKLPG